MTYTIHHGDCLDVMRTLDAGSVDAVVTDPPYGLAFMGKKWDHGVPGAPFWIEALRVAKPGAHLLAFGGTRTYHRLACAIEDAGWEIRDCLSWLYGSGFPKSHDVSKAIDKGGSGCGWFIDYCLEVASERGITKKQLSSLFPSKNGNATGWLYNKASHNQDLTPAQFNALRDFLSLPFPDLSSAKREIIGRRTSGLTAGTIANFSGEREFDVTAPATDLARKWDGWGTALKPAWEPVIMARKPLIGTVAANVTAHGTGALNIDGCRIGVEGGGTNCDNRDADGKCLGHGNAGRSTSGETVHAPLRMQRQSANTAGMNGIGQSGFASDHVQPTYNPLGRWPANVALDEDAAAALDEQAPETGGGIVKPYTRASQDYYSGAWPKEMTGGGHEKEAGGASRFFYTAKASRGEREAGLREAGLREATFGSIQGGGPDANDPVSERFTKTARNTHPTVKPVDLMRWLVRLVTPTGGTVLDPFTGSGSTGVAALEEGCHFIGIEREAEYVAIARARCEAAARAPLFDFGAP